METKISAFTGIQVRVLVGAYILKVRRPNKLFKSINSLFNVKKEKEIIVKKKGRFWRNLLWVFAGYIIGSIIPMDEESTQFSVNLLIFILIVAGLWNFKDKWETTYNNSKSIVVKVLLWVILIGIFIGLLYLAKFLNLI